MFIQKLVNNIFSFWSQFSLKVSFDLSTFKIMISSFPLTIENEGGTKQGKENENEGQRMGEVLEQLIQILNGHLTTESGF